MKTENIAEFFHLLCRNPFIQLFQKMTGAAEAWVALTPDNLDASRTLSVAYKKVGTEHEMLGRPDDAIALYEKAATLDRARVQRDPGRGLWQLDLSFAYGAIGSALAKKGQTAAALDRYRQAVELRHAVAASNPDDDFAKTSLARGHERVASLLGALGDVDGALAADEARIRVFTERRLAHPDREAAWKDEATAAFSAAQRSLDLLEAQPASTRRARVPRVRAMLDRLTALHADWARHPRAPVLAPSPQQLREMLGRCDRLAAGAPSGTT